MKFRILQSIFGLVLLVFLSACNDALIPNFKLVSDANTMNTRQVATAVDAKGWKHTLWNECYSPPEKEHCRLVYARYQVNAPASPVDYKYYTPYSLDYSYIDPDIAVTDDGAAYGVWRLKNTNPITKVVEYSNCWQNLLIDSTCNVFVSPTNNASVSGAPRIAARGSTVYAVIEEKLPGGTATQLFFRRLNPLSNFNYAISPSNATAANTSPDLAISPAGTLHVVWDDQEKFLYADNVGNVSANMSIRWNFTSSTQASRPKIVIDEGIGNEALVYIAYADMLPASDQLHLYSFLWSDAQHLPLDSTQLNLTTNLPWNLYGDPAIAATGSGANSTVYGAFTAANSSTIGSSQIFRFSYSKGGSNPIPTMVTNPTDYPAGKSSPLVTVVHDNKPGSPLLTPVIAWRNEALGPNAFDTFLYNMPNGIRKVFTTSTGTVGYTQGSYTFDLASNGKQAGGVWIDARSSSDARRVPWATMNGSQVFVPLLLK